MIQHERTLQAGISIVCAVRNRSQPLVFTIPTWLENKHVSQIIIVDWNSDAVLWDELAKLDIPGWPDERVSIVRAEQQQKWSIARAINLGSLLVEHEYLFKLDADILMTDRIVVRPKRESTFVAGNWRTASCKQDVYLNGTMLVATSDFRSTGGYDERYVGYGWDDSDLYDRLQSQGLKRQDFRRKTLFHLPHSDGKRINKDSVSGSTPAECIENARRETLRREPWSACSDRIQWDIERATESQRHFLAREVSQQDQGNDSV